MMKKIVYKYGIFAKVIGRASMAIIYKYQQS
jgi:hypothetical protein